MRVTFLSQTGFIAEHDGRRFVMDPWLTDGAFEGAWFHYPPQRLGVADLGQLDGLFISHLHGDHCDAEVLARIDKAVPLFILDRNPNFLERYLRQRGFQDIRKIASGQSAVHGPWEITLFEPFSGHDYFETKVGNLIDSSILLRAGGGSFLNFTDNFPTPEAARRLGEEYGPISLASVPYNGAGDYPACCQSLDQGGKLDERARLQQRNLERLIEVAAALQPEILCPSSAEYVLAGSLAAKNRYLVQCSAEEAAGVLAASGYTGRVQPMREGTCIDLTTGEVEQTLPVAPVPARERFGESLERVPFPYEVGPMLTPAEVSAVLVPALEQARAHLWARQQQLGFFSDCRTYIALGEQEFLFRWSDPACAVVPAGQHEAPYVRFALDTRLLRRMMDGRAHWNNAAVGCHIDFWREPNVYNPDLWTMMAFFHPRAPSPQPQPSAPEPGQRAPAPARQIQG
jgi:UDP-MurNAc hydroxylase